MAVAQEDSRPVLDILDRTLEMPEGCQWALFLRNHDELTLEMVTHEERNYLWQFYATHRRLRINLGIRRRLAPLLGGDRRRIELLNSLLFSLPGTPIVYYGDEIGMGDNPFLGDRDGVRTPMQWSSDRNGGFSRADPVALYLPPIADAAAGYHAVNVELQRQLRSSLLNWMRWIIGVRNAHRAFGRGALRFLATENRKVMAYLRLGEGESILCVANLSETAQPAALDLTEWSGRTPVDLFGGALFPPISSSPYHITVTGHGFFWLELVQRPEPDGREHKVKDRPALPPADRPLPPRRKG